MRKYKRRQTACLLSYSAIFTPPRQKLKNVHIRLLYATSLSMHVQFGVLTPRRELQLSSRFKGVRPDLCLMTIRDLQMCLRSLINEQNWLLIQERSTLIDLTLFYKIQYNLVLLPFPNDLTVNTSCTRKSHNKTYKLLPALVDPYKYSFFARRIPVWNSLPLEAVNAQSLTVYNATVNSFLFPTA